jgi:NhaA family Na+:H+ antiporter
MAPANNSREFIKLETMGANLLLGATILALILSNSPWHDYYEKIFHGSFSIHLDTWQFKINALFLINEGLMSIFFLVVGLEIKYEILQGTLNSLPKALLPGFAALGGMVIPALIYIGLNYRDVVSLRGWAIPTATDIAFALGVLSLLGNRVSVELKTFLTALAIFDDLAAIIIIAIFYTAHLSFLFLGLALLCLGVLFILSLKKINSIFLYCLMGFILWVCFLNAGVNPTLAGVALAFLIPLEHSIDRRPSPSKRLKNLLHPGVALGILPLFAFANAGISFFDLSTSSLHFSIVIGILVSLFFGKQVGVFGACWLAVKLRMAQLPNKVRLVELYGISIICGIGFTISLFIGALAFEQFSIGYSNSVKIGVLGGSLLSGVAGYLLLSLNTKKQKI